MQNAHMRVDGAAPRGFLRFLSLTAFQAEDGGLPMGPQSGPGSEGSEGSACLWQAGSKGGGIALWAMSIKSALRDLAFCVIWHDKHSADWLATLASPYPASPDFPRKRGQNKANA